MPAIHFIAKKQENVHPVRGTDGEWESGNWHVDEEKATALVGASLFIHEGQNAPSYFGGKIISFRPTEEGLVFRFKFDASCKGVVSPRGWSKGIKLEP